MEIRLGRGAADQQGDAPILVILVEVDSETVVFGITLEDDRTRYTGDSVPATSRKPGPESSTIRRGAPVRWPPWWV